MPRSPLSPELKAYVAQRYLADTPPRDLVVELQTNFGVDIRPSALRQMITRSGLAKRRVELEKKTCALVSSSTVDRLARARAAEPKAVLSGWADRSAAAADKAFDFVDAATRPRDLASAAAAAAASVKMFRLCLGLDVPDSGTRPVFNFNFASEIPRKLTAAELGQTEIAVSTEPSGTTSVAVSHKPTAPRPLASPSSAAG